MLYAIPPEDINTLKFDKRIKLTKYGVSRKPFLVGIKNK